MRLAKTSRGDPNELGVRAQLVDRAAPHVAHAAAQSADHLEQHVGHGTAIRHASLDPFGHQLLRRQLALLEIAIGAAVLHRRQAAHAAHHLEAAAFEQERLARALLRAGQHRAHHDARRARGERLDGVARILDAAVGDHRHVARAFDRVEHGGELRNAHARDDARRADRARANADLHRVNAALDERGGRLARRDVAGDELNVRERFAHLRGRVEHGVGVSVRRVDDDRVDAGVDERASAIDEVAAGADRRRDAQASELDPCSRRDTADACECP